MNRGRFLTGVFLYLFFIKKIRIFAKKVMVILEFICVILCVIASLLYINNIIVDIGSAISAARTFSPTGADDSEKAILYAKIRIFLSLIIGLTLGFIICF